MDYGIVRLIEKLNSTRSYDDLQRRMMKIFEEVGELSEAFLHVTTASNPKGKTWSDFREEGADILIMLIDTALTPLPESNYPHIALLPQAVSEGFVTPCSLREGDLDTIIPMTMKMVADISVAYDAAFGSGGKTRDLRFCGALSRAISDIMKIALMRFPNDVPDQNIDFITILNRKLKKWERQKDAGYDVVSGAAA